MLDGKYKILIVVRWPGGGIRTFIRYVYRHFEPELFHLTIIGPNVPEISMLKEDLKGLEVEIKTVPVRQATYELFKSVTKCVISGNYDLVHSQGFTSGICAFLPAFLTCLPHVLTPHDILNEKQFKGISGQFKKKVVGVSLSLIQTIHCVSYDSYDNLMKMYPFLCRSPRKCIVIRNGIEVERFINAKQRDLRTDLDIGTDTFLIGYLGRFMSLKGFIYLIEAIDELSKNKDITKDLLVVAFGEGEFIREEKALIYKRGLSQFFTFQPFTPNVASTLKALDVVVMPSISEACGLLAMETLVAGIPLIATSCTGLREVIRNTPTYVIPPQNSKALTEALIYFINVDSRLTFKQFSKEAATLFDVRPQAEKIIQLLTEKIIHKQYTCKKT